ncbi:MAG: lysostaphin resistance A-like protein [Lachnospiraceae bacterium]
MDNTIYKDARKQFSRIGLVLFLGTLLISAVQIGAIEVASGIAILAGNKDLLFLSYMLPMYLIAFPLTFLLFRCVPAKQQKEKKTMSLKDFFSSFLITYSGGYLFAVVANLLIYLIGILKQNPVNNVLMDTLTGIHPATTFLLTVICAPLFEELLFRKMLIDRISNYGEGVSVFFSGFIFGLFHGNLSQFCYAFFLGSFLAFIYCKTKNILYPIILHLLFNFFNGFLSLQIMGREEDTITLLYSCLIICAVISGLVIFLVNKKKFIFTEGEFPLEKGRRFTTIFLNPGVLLFCIFWIGIIIYQLLM